MGTTSVKTARSEDLEVVRVPVQELTADAFAPYGEVSRPGAGLAVDVADGAVSTCHVRCTVQPATVEFLARHKMTTQLYAPLGAGESILIVAPASPESEDSPAIDRARIAAFRLDGSCAINLHRGTWHRAPMPVSGTADFLVIDREGTLDDLELLDLGSELGVALEVAG